MCVCVCVCVSCVAMWYVWVPDMCGVNPHLVCCSDGEGKHCRLGSQSIRVEDFISSANLNRDGECPRLSPV